MCPKMLFLSTHPSAIEPEGSGSCLVVSMHRRLPGFQQGSTLAGSVQRSRACVYGFDVVLDVCYICPFGCCYVDGVVVVIERCFFIILSELS